MPQENKTPDSCKPGGGQGANNMGGPSFHPEIDQEIKKPKTDTAKNTDEEAILKPDQVPPL